MMHEKMEYCSYTVVCCVSLSLPLIWFSFSCLCLCFSSSSSPSLPVHSSF